MRKILKIAGNELRALFCSPVAWFILVIFAVQSGMTFTDLFRSVLRQQFMGEPIEYSITTALLTGMSGTFTVIQQYLYLYVPLLTMGLMSREFGSGSIVLVPRDSGTDHLGKIPFDDGLRVDIDGRVAGSGSFCLLHGGII